MRTYSCKTNKLRNVYTIWRGASKNPIKKWKINYFKIKIVSFIININETMPFVMDKVKSKKGASVFEEYALFNWSSVGYI